MEDKAIKISKEIDFLTEKIANKLIMELNEMDINSTEALEKVKDSLRLCNILTSLEMVKASNNL